MGREVRRVPANWEHPKDNEGRYIPLLDGLCEALARWYRHKAMWDLGYREDWTKANTWQLREEDETGEYSEWSGTAPDPADYMPDWSDDARTHLQMYESTSEGTPISPVCKTPEELARWLADNNASAFANETATYEQWLATIKRGWAISAVGQVGKGLISGVAALAEAETAE